MFFLVLRIWSYNHLPDAERSLRFQPDVFVQPGRISEEDSSLLERFQAMQLIVFASNSRIHLVASVLLTAPFPDASQTPYSETNTGNPASMADLSFLRYGSVWVEA